LSSKLGSLGGRGTRTTRRSGEDLRFFFGFLRKALISENLTQSVYHTFNQIQANSSINIEAQAQKAGITPVRLGAQLCG
jgi:hypothetical protein